MKKLKQKAYFKVAALVAGVAWSSISFASPLTNGDFSSNNFNGWQGDVTSAGPISSLPGSFGSNFDASSGAAVLTADNTEWSVHLFQTFDLSSTALALNFDYSWVADDTSDTWIAQLVDTSNTSHFLSFDTASAGASGNGQFDLSGFSGLSVQLLFGLENIAGSNDTLTIDNIAITESQPNGSVPEPSALLLISAGLLAAKRKFS